MKKKILWFIHHAINLIYPNVCGICDRVCKDNLCKKCEIYLNKIAKIKIDTYLSKNFGKHLFIFVYEGTIKERLINFKFHDKIYIYKSFVNFMRKNKKICKFLKSYDIIIPVPIHYQRKIIRGYNQSDLLAKEIAKYFDNLEYVHDVLLKKVNNKPQRTKSKTDRKANVVGAYYIKKEEKIKNKKVLLLDDIYTTGSTVNECTKVLMKADANLVDVITIAKD